MITEDYCSYELSELLREKGFDGLCHRYDFEDWRGRHTDTVAKYPNNFNKNNGSTSIPTHQMVMKWLREVHKIYADPIQQGNYDDNSIYYSYVVAQIIDGRSYIHRPMSVVDKLSYEEAVEAAIKYSLENLI